METTEEVDAVFKEVRSRIEAIDQALSKERESIRRAAFYVGRKLTAEENARLDEIRATRKMLGSELKTLGFSTIEKLEKAEDLDALVSAIQSVTQQLDNDVGRLDKLVEFAKKTADVGAKLAAVTERLVGLRDTLTGSKAEG